MRLIEWFSNTVSRAGEIGHFCGAFSKTFLTTLLSFQAFNENMKAGDKRMTAERCGYLSLVAIAHKLEEAWICFFPVLPLMYISQYLPTIGKRYSSIIVILDSSSCSFFFSANVWIELLQLCSALEDFFPIPKQTIFLVLSWSKDSSRVMHSLAYYSWLPNNRAGPDNRAGGKIWSVHGPCRSLIIVPLGFSKVYHIEPFFTNSLPYLLL